MTIIEINGNRLKDPIKVDVLADGFVRMFRRDAPEELFGDIITEGSIMFLFLNDGEYYAGTYHCNYIQVKYLLFQPVSVSILPVRMPESDQIIGDIEDI